MAGTNAYAAKRALIDLLAASPALEGVGVGYSYSGKLAEAHREIVYGGQVGGPVDILTMGGAIGSRDERPILQLHLDVTTPGESDTAAAEARVVELGTVVEELIVANPTFGGVPNLLNTRIAGFELDSAFEDESAMATLTYQIELESCITGG